MIMFMKKYFILVQEGVIILLIPSAINFNPSSSQTNIAADDI